MPTIEENILRFEELLGSVQKEGISKLMNYIRNNTDFYKAPASTRFHLACEGGLLQHSLNVYDCLVAKKESPIWKPILSDIPDESLIIMALLHDLCKANFYSARGITSGKLLRHIRWMINCHSGTVKSLSCWSNAISV